MFWKSWVCEYLPSLLIREKWSQRLRNFKVGDLVLIASDHTPRSNWPLGRIMEVFDASNDIVHTLRLKTRSGEILRPGSWLALLEATCD